MLDVFVQPDGSQILMEKWCLKMYMRGDMTDELLISFIEGAVKIYDYDTKEVISDGKITRPKHRD